MDSRSYDDLANQSRCTGCSAACCRMVLFPVARPQTFLDVDYIRFLLGFPSLEIQQAAEGR